MTDENFAATKKTVELVPLDQVLEESGVGGEEAVSNLKRLTPTQQAALDNYKALNAEAISRANSLFDLFATKTLLPIFTAILGYIFGSRATAGSGASE